MEGWAGKEGWIAREGGEGGRKQEEGWRQGG